MAEIFLWLLIESFLAAGGAEIVGYALMFRVMPGSLGIYGHFTYRVYYLSHNA